MKVAVRDVYPTREDSWVDVDVQINEGVEARCHIRLGVHVQCTTIEEFDKELVRALRELAERRWEVAEKAHPWISKAIRLNQRARE